MNAKQWNEAHQIGQRVAYKPGALDEPVLTHTRSTAWQGAKGEQLIKLNDVVGGVPLAQVTPIGEDDGLEEIDG